MYNKQWSLNHRSKARSRYLLKREELLAAHKKWYEQNRESSSQYARNWQKEHPQATQVTRAKSRRKLKEDIIAAYGGKCACCQNTTFEFLCLDHIDGGGSTERLLFKVGGNTALYRNVRKNGFPAKYTVLCFNCNAAKAFYGACPHSDLYAREHEIFLTLQSTSKAAAAQRSWRSKIKHEVFIAYGSKCACCNETKLEFMTIDHSGNNGHEERKESKGTMMWITLRQKSFPKEGYRLLCYNCNLARGFYGYCPHTFS